MFQHISQEEARELMARRDDVIILDVRREDEFAQGHIPGAICIPVETIGDDDIPQLPDLNATILVYCRSGRRSVQAAIKLDELGYTDIREFGGILTWKGPVVS